MMTNQSTAHGVALFLVMCLMVFDGKCNPQHQTSLAGFGDNKISRDFYGRVRDLLEQDIMQSDDPIATRPLDVI